MGTTKKQLLQALIRKFAQTLKELHDIKNFPFGSARLGHQEVMILLAVAEKSTGASIKELGAALKVTPGAITQFTDSLVKKNLVKREVDSSDRRVTKIKLTATAKKQLNKFQQSYFQAVSCSFGSLRISEIRQLMGLLKKIRLPGREA
ncbi:MAG: MarR family transcriptional regulator [Patescibacteria group bacterium]